MTHSPRWTPEEDKLLTRLAKAMLPSEDIRKHMPHRSLASIDARRNFLRKEGADIPRLSKGGRNITCNYKYKNMCIKVIGSSSAGNGYAIITPSGECLALEAGLPFVELLRAVDYDRSKIEVCLVSHIHGDHAKFKDEYISEGINLHMGEELKPLTWHIYGRFKVMPFPVEHDVPNSGFIIKHPELGVLFFATDCAHIPHLFHGIDHWLIEANYSDAKLLLSDTNAVQKKRIVQSHQSFETCKEYLIRSHAELSKTITLIHLSSRHSNPEQFKKELQQEFGLPVVIAKHNTSIPLNIL